MSGTKSAGARFWKAMNDKLYASAMNSDLTGVNKQEPTFAEELSKPMFVAVPLPASIMELLASFAKDNCELKNIKWIPEQNYHVTLLYIGRMNPVIVPEVQSTLFHLFKTIESFKLSFREIAVVQKNGKDKMIWTQFSASEHFVLCSHKIREALLPLVKIEQQYPDPIPHVTLARLNHSSVLKKMDNHINNRIFSIPVNHCELWESNRGEHGVYYKRISFFKLGGISAVSNGPLSGIV